MPGRYDKGSPPTKEDFTGYEKDEATGLHYAGARYYSAAFGRFTTTDRFADKYPSHSPYHYSKNNPATWVDINGDTVRTETREEAERAAEDLNETVGEAHEGDPNITVTEHEVTETESAWWDPGGIFGTAEEKTETEYRLSTEDSNFDWGKSKYTSGLYDAINSSENTFTVKYVPGETNLTGHPLNRSAYDIQGMIDEKPGGGTIFISADGNRLNEPTGVVLMHELVGHGHPAGGSNAHDVNRYFQNRLGYDLNGSRGMSHDGYKRVIGWERKGLYK